MTPEERLKEIREREQKATKGPWELKFADPCYLYPNGVYYVYGPENGIVVSMWGTHYPKEVTGNATFLTEARTDIPYLLSEIERLQKLVDDHENPENWHPVSELPAYQEMKKENEKLREALGFYADEERYDSKYPGGCCYECCGGCSLIHEDNGQRARQALNGNIPS